MAGLWAACLKAKILAEKWHHVNLEVISHFTGVSAWINFGLVRDSILIENIMQFAGINP
jgi:hypothetical protein